MVKSLTTKTDNTEKRFLHLYRVVHEREKYLSTEALIVQYSTLLRFFVKFLQQKDSKKIIIIRMLSWFCF